jgi:hypothetical protein
MKIVLETVSGIRGVLHDTKKPTVMLSGTDSSSVHLKLYYWIDTFDKSISGVKVKTEVLGQCIKALVNAGFYLPNTITELKNYKDTRLELQGSGERT